MVAESLLAGGVVLTILTPALAFAVYWFGEKEMRKHAHSPK